MPNGGPKDTDREQLIETIASLLAGSTKDWVTWKSVAKEQEGTAAVSVQLLAEAQFHNKGQGPDYFDISNNEKRVRLTPKGVDRAVEFEQADDKSSDDESRHTNEVATISKAVKDYASGLNPLRLKVDAVSHVTQINGRHLCAVKVEMKEGAVNLTEVPVTLRGSAGNIRGKVVGQEPDSGRLHISFHQKPATKFSSATLRIDRGYLLNALAEAIGDLQCFPDIMGQLLNEETEQPVRDEDSVEVAEQILELDKPWGRLLWGPPGSGKTYGVAHFVKELVRQEPKARVLLVAPSNLAVDVGLSETVEHFLDGHEHHARLVEDRKITRYGYPRKSEILERSELLGPPNLDQLNEKVRELSKQIRKAERKKEAGVDPLLWTVDGFHAATSE